MTKKTIVLIVIAYIAISALIGALVVPPIIGLLAA